MQYFTSYLKKVTDTDYVTEHEQIENCEFSLVSNI